MIETIRDGIALVIETTKNLFSGLQKSSLTVSKIQIYCTLKKATYLDPRFRVTDCLSLGPSNKLGTAIIVQLKLHQQNEPR